MNSTASNDDTICGMVLTIASLNYPLICITLTLHTADLNRIEVTLLFIRSPIK